MKLVIITWAAFFLRQKPVSTRAKPACMNITRNPVTRVQAKLMAILFLPTASVTAFAWPCSTPVGRATGDVAAGISGSGARRDLATTGRWGLLGLGGLRPEAQ